MTTMDAAREQALVRYATYCIMSADRVAEARRAGTLTPDEQARILEESLRHMSALTTMFMLGGAPVAPPPVPRARWRRIVHRIGRWLTTL